MHTDRRGYLYRSFRENGEVRREYLGRGADADLIARLDLTRRERLERERADLQAARRDQARANGALAPVGDLADLIVRAAMLASGHHLRKREWRRKRRGD